MTFIDQAINDTMVELGSMPLDWDTYSIDYIERAHGVVEYHMTLYNVNKVEVAHVTITINETAQSIDVIKEIVR